MEGLRIAFGLAILLLFSRPGLATDWVEYASENFTVYSDAHEVEALEMLENFEIFRLTTLAVLGLPYTPESERLMIVMYGRSRDFNRIAPRNAAGFFYHSIFGPRMIVGPVGGVGGVEGTLFHEYVHYLMHRRSPMNYPRWYSEGLATVLGLTEIDKTRIVVGKPPVYNSPYRPRTSVEDAIDLTPGTAYDGFYETAWRMTHYFMIDTFDDPGRKHQMVDYLRRFDAGEDPIEAFDASFGMSPKEMDAVIRAYALQRTIKAITMPRFEYGGDISRRELGEAESLYLRGDLAIELDSYEAAYDYFDDLEKLKPDTGSPFRAKAASRRAIGLVHEKRIDEGDALIGQLLAMPDHDADVLTDLAHYAFDRFGAEEERADGPDTRHLDRSIEYGRHAVASDAGDLEAFYYLGLAYEKRGELQHAADTLLAAYDLNPSVPRLNRNLARVLIKGRQHEFGSYLVSRLYSASHSEAYRAGLLELLQDLEDGRVDDIALMESVLP